MPFNARISARSCPNLACISVAKLLTACAKRPTSSARPSTFFTTSCRRCGYLTCSTCALIHAFTLCNHSLTAWIRRCGGRSPGTLSLWRDSSSPSVVNEDGAWVVARRQARPTVMISPNAFNASPKGSSFSAPALRGDFRTSAAMGGLEARIQIPSRQQSEQTRHFTLRAAFAHSGSLNLDRFPWRQWETAGTTPLSSSLACSIKLDCESDIKAVPNGISLTATAPLPCRCHAGDERRTVEGMAAQGSASQISEPCATCCVPDRSPSGPVRLDDFVGCRGTRRIGSEMRLRARPAAPRCGS